MRTITTIHNLIAELGGPTELAAWAGINPHAVCQWETRGVIPPGWHLRLMIRAKELGFKIDPASVFGVPPREAQIIESSFDWTPITKLERSTAA